MEKMICARATWRYATKEEQKIFRKTHTNVLQEIFEKIFLFSVH